MSENGTVTLRVSNAQRCNKTNIQFNIYNNAELIVSLQQIEYTLLSSINHKTPVYGLYNELISGRITVHDYADTIVLKISGIWETETTCGVTYKFV
jgi:hypothetical protein